MVPEDGSRNGKRKVRELCGPVGARRSAAVSMEYGEAQVSARRTAVTSLNIQGGGANLGHRVSRASRLSILTLQCRTELNIFTDIDGVTDQFEIACVSVDHVRKEALSDHNFTLFVTAQRSEFIHPIGDRPIVS